MPDNTKSGVTRADIYDPDLNVHYHQMSRHYGTAILPARPYRARDKAKDEKGVQVVQNWILAVLRNRDFFSIAELNQAIWELLEVLNNKSFKRLVGTRASCFRSIDKPAMKPLPQLRYEDEEWKKARVECFFRNNRVASHPRDDRQAKHSTQREHMPKAHQKYLDWTPER